MARPSSAGAGRLLGRHHLCSHIALFPPLAPCCFNHLCPLPELAAPSVSLSLCCQPPLLSLRHLATNRCCLLLPLCRPWSATTETARAGSAPALRGPTAAAHARCKHVRQLHACAASSLGNLCAWTRTTISPSKLRGAIRSASHEWLGVARAWQCRRVQAGAGRVCAGRHGCSKQEAAPRKTLAPAPANNGAPQHTPQQHKRLPAAQRRPLRPHRPLACTSGTPSAASSLSSWA